MNIAQRGTSIAITGSTNGYTADRFFTENNHDGAWTFTQSSDAPDNKFKNSLKVDVTTADTSLASSQYCQIQHRIEAQYLHAVENFRQPMTFSFWVKSNKTGNYSFTLQQNDNSNRQMPGQYTINAANTWEKKIITVPADSSGLVNDDNGIGLILTWGLAYGSNYTSGSVATNNAFEAYSGGDFGVGQGVNLLDSTDNEWYLTGVQMEVGSQATPFEHRSFTDELALCQRYYYKSTQYGYKIQNPIDSAQTVDGDGFLGWVFYNNTSCRSPHYNHPVEMRATPTVNFYSSDRVASPSDGKMALYTLSAWVNLSSNTATVNTRRLAIKGVSATNFSAAQVYLIGGGFECGAEL
tara:strand:- start:366 stop:1421 length:1056 start_codon:yes stop_codon:yes gene_type:complete